MNTQPVWLEAGILIPSEAAKDPQKALAAAKLDFRIERMPLFARSSTGKALPVSQAYVVGRPDEGIVFGVVGKRYVVPQNSELFEYFREFIQDGFGWFHAAGSIRRGRLVWILLRLPGELSIGGQKIEKYLLLVNEYGMHSLTISFLPVRVEDFTTLGISLAALKDPTITEGVRIKHAPDFYERLYESKRLIAGMAETFHIFCKVGETLAARKVSLEEAESYFRVVFPPKVVKRKGFFTLRRGVIKDGVFGYAARWFPRVCDLFKELPEERWTAWEAFCLVANFLDYHAVAVRKSSRESVAARRWEWIISGQGTTIKRRAWDLVVATFL